MKVGKAYALSRATIINAMANHKGGAFAIDLKLYAEVEINNSGEIKVLIEDNPNEDTRLVETCVKKIFKRFGLEGLGANVRTRSEIPIARGLASSSAAANAVILATLSALNKEMDYEEILRINVEASIESGVSITGAFDDASASLLGGGVLTDNKSLKILKRFLMDNNLYVILTIPEEKKYTKDVNKDKILAFKDYVDIAFETAFKNIYKAIVLNSIIYCSIFGYSIEPIYVALKSGAISSGLCGKGPTFFALCYEDKVDEIRDTYETYGRVVITRVENSGSRIVK